MMDLDDEMQTAARTAREAAGRAIDLDADLAAAVARANRLPPDRGLRPPSRDLSWRPLLAVAAVLLIAVLAGGLVLMRGSDDEQIATVTVPETSDVATAPTSTMVAPAPVPSSGVSSTTTTPSSTTEAPPPTAPAATVSYADPPPPVGMQSLGTVELAPRDGGEPWVDVGIGDRGVIVNQSWAGYVTVVGFDSIERDVRIDVEFEVDDGLFLPVYGPGDVLYGMVTTDSGVAMPNLEIVAIPLAGERAGRAVASAPLDLNRYLELPVAPVGHGPDGVVDRLRDVNRTLIGYVDENGEPIAWSEPSPPLYTVPMDEFHEGGRLTVTEVGGPSWLLEFQPAPERGGTFVGPSAPAPSSDGLGVYWTHLDNAAPGNDFDDPTTWVIAALHPDGHAEWWSVPDGWEVVASDVWGTVLAKRDVTSLELALADFGAVKTPTSSRTCVENELSGRVQFVLGVGDAEHVVVPDGADAATVARLLGLDVDVVEQVLGGQRYGQAATVLGIDDVFVLGPAGELGGALVSSSSELGRTPLAGPAASLADGTVLVTGGPTSELLAISDQARSNWQSLLDIAMPPVAEDVDFQWFEWGQPAPRDADRFWLPAILNATPVDRSWISKQPYLLSIDRDGGVDDVVTLDAAPVRDISLQIAAAADGTTWVVASSGALAAYSPSGAPQWQSRLGGVPLAVAVDSQGVAVLLGDGPDDDLGASGRLVTCR